MSKYDLQKLLQLQKVFLDLTNLHESDENWLCAGRKGAFYGDALVIWMFILQALGNSSQAQVVRQLQQGMCDEILKQSGSAHLQHAKISSNTGGFNRAKSRLDLDKLQDVSDLIYEGIKCEAGDDGKIYALDGFDISMDRSQQNQRAYKLRRNNHGKLHYPQMHIVAASSLVSGVIPKWVSEPSKTCSESRMGVNLLANLPTGAMIMADRNFGVFAVVSAAQQAKQEILVRMQDIRAKRLFSNISKLPECDQNVTWSQSENDQHVPTDAPKEIAGRLLKCTLKQKGFRDLKIILFTTSTRPAAELIELYAQRWVIETDIRYLKQFFALYLVRAKTPQAVLKEILAKFLAYNLMRRIISNVAKKLQLQPRQLSFSGCVELIIGYGKLISEAKTEFEAERLLGNFLTNVRQVKHPNRTRKRTEPRAVVWRETHFPLIKGKRNTKLTQGNL